MILTVTLNPMLDKTIYVDRFLHGRISRSHRSESVAGGKGINVARQLHVLGIKTLATGFLGGEIGNAIERLVHEEGIPCDFVRIQDTTRIGFTILETATGEQTSVFEPGHKVTREEVEHLRSKVTSLLQQPGRVQWLVLSGIVPCEGMDALYADLTHYANRYQVPVALDTYAEPLAHGIRAQPFMVKPNVKEYEETFGPLCEDMQSQLADDKIIMALDYLRSYGVTLAIVSQGDKAAWASYGDEVWRMIPPTINCANPTGCGDAMIAGVLYGYMQRWSVEDALRFGMASGAANARVWRVASSSLEEIVALLGQVKMERVSRLDKGLAARNTNQTRAKRALTHHDTSGSSHSPGKR